MAFSPQILIFMFLVEMILLDYWSLNLKTTLSSEALERSCKLFFKLQQTNRMLML